MRILVCGTRSFGRAVTNSLANVGPWEVVGVVAPVGDRTANEGRALGLPVYETVAPELVRSLKVDLIVAAHSHAFIGARSRRAATHGAIGYHPSLLPRHRGRDAVRWTIKMGDPIAGGSVYQLTDNVDAGPTIRQDWCHVRPGWTHHDLWRERLFGMGVDLLQTACHDFATDDVAFRPQDEAVSTWEPSWEREPVWRPELPELGEMPEGHRVEMPTFGGAVEINGRANL